MPACWTSTAVPPIDGTPGRGEIAGKERNGRSAQRLAREIVRTTVMVRSGARRQNSRPAAAVREIKATGMSRRRERGRFGRLAG